MAATVMIALELLTKNMHYTPVFILVSLIVSAFAGSQHPVNS
jgi:hypothetical protein